MNKAFKRLESAAARVHLRPVFEEALPHLDVTVIESTKTSITGMGDVEVEAKVCTIAVGTDAKFQGPELKKGKAHLTVHSS